MFATAIAESDFLRFSCNDAQIALLQSICLLLACLHVAACFAAPPFSIIPDPDEPGLVIDLGYGTSALLVHSVENIVLIDLLFCITFSLRVKYGDIL